MHSTTLLLPALAALLETTSAHGWLTGVKVGSTFTAGADPVWFYYPVGTAPATAGWNALNQDIGFVEPASFGTSNISCHKSATAGKLYASANAGDSVAFSWSTWPDSHKGPVMNYIAPCDGDCSTTSAATLKWTKISQSGLLTPSTNTWATDVLRTNNYTSSAVIPPKLKAGNYVVRHEIIALHGAQNDNGAQAYPQCINIKVGGSGTVAPPTGVLGSVLYKRTDAGILFNLYVGATSYTFPGPSVWTGAN